MMRQAVFPLVFLWAIGFGVPPASAERAALVFIATNAKLAAAAEAAAMAGLSDAGLTLVERTQLDAVLREQALNVSALAERDRAVQVGRVIGAQVLLIVQKLAGNEPAYVARAVETATGVILDERLAMGGDAELLATTVTDVGVRAASILATPEDQRLYAAVLPFNAELPDAAGRVLAGGLSPLLRHALQQSPGVVVVEREELRRLVEEEALAGVAVKLRGTGVLIYGSVSATASADEVELAMRMEVAGAEPIARRVRAAAALPAMRDAALDVIEQAGLTRLDRAPHATADEAMLLLTRTRLTTQTLDAVRHAVEAALALDQSPPVVHRAMHELRIGFNKARREDDELAWTAHLMRLAQLQGQLLRDPPPVPSRERSKLLLALHCYSHLSYKFPTTPEGRGPAAELAAMDEENYRLAVAYLGRYRTNARFVMEPHLDQVMRITQGTDDFAPAVIAMLQALQQEEDRHPARRGEHWREPGIRELDAIPHWITHGNLTLQQARPVVDWCLSEGGPHLRLLAWRVLAKHAQGDEAVTAAQRILDEVFQPDSTSGDPWQDAGMSLEHPFWPPVRTAAERLTPQQLETWLERVIARAETDHDLTALIRYPPALVLLARDVEQATGTDVAPRALALLDQFTETQWDERSKQSRFRGTQDLWTEQAERVRRARGKTVENHWDDIVVEPVPFTGRLPHMAYPLIANFDPPISGERDDSLLIVWSDQPTMQVGPRRLTATRSSPDGGPLRVIADATIENLACLWSSSDWNTQAPLIEAGGRVLVAFRHALVILHGHEATVLRDVGGGGTMVRAAGRTFLFAGGLVEFHHDTGRLETIASKDSAVARHELDGPGTSRSALAGHPHHPWLFLIGRRQGGKNNTIWRMDAATRQFTEILPNANQIGRFRWWHDRLVIPNYFIEIDPAAGVVLDKPFAPPTWPEDQMPAAHLRETTARVGDYWFFPAQAALTSPHDKSGRTHVSQTLPPEPILWRETMNGAWCFYDRLSTDGTGPMVYRIRPRPRRNGE